VKLIGVPKIDPYLFRKNSNTKVESIGICSNLLDPIQSVESVVNAILEAFPDCKITYRPHPGDQRQTEFKSNRLNISNSKVEKPFDFLSKQDLIIAGNTSIHYEAAMLNVVSIYYKFDQQGLSDDTYGFVKNGLVDEAKNLNELQNIISTNRIEKKEMGEKAQFYNALLGTEQEGKSQALVAERIKQIISHSTST